MGKNGRKSLIDSMGRGRRLTEEKPKAASLIAAKDQKGLPFLTFSFRYCSQQDYFGIAGQDAAWFANLQDRLKDLSGKTGAIVEDTKAVQDYRLHPINWDKSPIGIEDLKSVPEVLRNAAEDDFFWQFQLSKGTGRVVGFFNEEMTVFYIVLLDPKHNIQPSKDFGYQVDDTEIALTEYERVQMSIAAAEDLRHQCKYVSDCPLTDLQNEYIRSDVFFACLDNDLKETYADLMRQGVFQERFKDFLLNEFMSD